MRKLCMLLAFICMLSGCATLTYESPDGTKVSYTRFCTGSDSIKGQAGTATIEAQGQKQLDPAVIQLLLEAAKMAK